MKTRTPMTRIDTQSGQVSPRIRITHILKRRKKTLKQWADELSLVTYASAVAHCEKVGVAPPTVEEWESAIGPIDLPPLVDDPTEGIAVVQFNAPKTNKKSKKKVTYENEQKSDQQDSCEPQSDIDA